jgi:hypothetical protein
LTRRDAGAYWIGAHVSTVSKWRHALGVEKQTKGTTRLRKAHGDEPWFARVRKKGQAKATDPERRRKLSEAFRGKKRPAT